jgi:hypothetical protein
MDARLNMIAKALPIFSDIFFESFDFFMDYLCISIEDTFGSTIRA